MNRFHIIQWIGMEDYSSICDIAIIVCAYDII